MAVEDLPKIGSDERHRVGRANDLKSIEDPIKSWKVHAAKMRRGCSYRESGVCPD